MAAIHVITLSTSLLEFYYENMGFSNLGDDEVKDELKNFQEALIKARNRGYYNSQIRWVVDYENPKRAVNEFAQEQNKINDL